MSKDASKEAEYDLQYRSTIQPRMAAGRTTSDRSYTSGPGGGGGSMLVFFQITFLILPVKDIRIFVFKLIRNF